MLGPPGAGKSMLARRLTTILPAMTLVVEVSSASVRHGDQAVHSWTADESSAHSLRWPRHLPALPVGMYAAAQPLHAT
jgi:predicted ATPase with chaperone activity